MLQVVDLEKRYGARTLFRDVSFTLTRGERLALVGRNGTGKSTIFRMILGEEHPDSGTITMPRGYTVGHLSQHLHFSEPSILAEACRGLPPGSEGEEYKAEIILDGLGFTQEEMQRPASSFSGGFQIRVELARVLLSQPNLLLLDEPTNYLDIVSARWLEEFLRDWEGEMILISHDRTFLDAVSTHTMIVHRGSARRVSGGTQKLYELIAQDETIYEQTRLNQERKRRDMQEFVDRFRAKAGTATLVQSRVKALEKMEVKDELMDEPVLDFSFTSAPFFGKTLLEAQSISFKYPDNEHGPGPEILKDFTLVIGKRDRIAVIGKNGRGKSTFLRLLAAELQPTQGNVRLSQHTAIGYFGQTNIARLSEKLTVEEEITSANPKLHRTKVRGICGTMMFSGDTAEKKVKVLSGGERSRVLLGKMLAQPTNLLLLDEPTNHLDIDSVAALVESIESYDGAVVLVTHDEFMLRKMAQRIVLFTERGAELIEGDYDYFMSTRGWGDAPLEAPKPSSKNASGSALERKERAKEREEKAPRVKEIARIEARIIELEDAIKKNEHCLAVESGKASQARLTELAKSIKDAKSEIDELFTKLDALA